MPTENNNSATVTYPLDTTNRFFNSITRKVDPHLIVGDPKTHMLMQMVQDLADTIEAEAGTEAPQYLKIDASAVVFTDAAYAGGADHIYTYDVTLPTAYSTDEYVVEATVESLTTLVLYSASVSDLDKSGFKLLVKDTLANGHKDDFIVHIKTTFIG